MSTATASIGFITDAEGNFDYWCRCVELSSVVCFDDTGELQFARGNEGDFFVFGGDVFDKGIGDIRIATALVRFKERYRERVFLLVGNRDLNKLRLTAELAETEIDVPQPVPLYPRAPPQFSLRAFLEELAARDGRPVEELNTAANRLRWILDHTMTARGAFEFRRQELELLRGAQVEGAAVSDDDVVRSFVESVANDDGFVWRYLEEANIGVVIAGNLFLHAGLLESAVGWLPPLQKEYRTPLPDEQCGGETLAEGHTVAQWVEAMNEFLRQGLADFRSQMSWRPDVRRRGGEGLLCMTSTPASHGKSIVVESLLQAGTPGAVSPVVEGYLRSAGPIHRLLCGHKPCGDSPFVVRREGLEVVHCDTTFSDSKAADSRGAAVAAVEVLLTQEQPSQLHLRGTLRDGRSYDFALLAPGGDAACEAAADTEAFVGRQLSGGKWVKARVADGSYHIAWSAPGDRNVSYETLSRSQVEDSLLGFDGTLLAKSVL